jgi:hypothetical protein
METMTEEALARLAAELFVTIRLLSGYPVPDAIPPIHSVPQAELAARVCGQPCAVQGYYLAGEGVFIDQALDVEGDARARSILLHELVHHLQGMSGRFDALPACTGWYARESEAYRIQNEYLQRSGSTRMFHPGATTRRCVTERE